jgi:hypothetical protein
MEDRRLSMKDPHRFYVVGVGLGLRQYEVRNVSHCSPSNHFKGSGHRPPSIFHPRFSILIFHTQSSILNLLSSNFPLPPNIFLKQKIRLSQTSLRLTKRQTSASILLGEVKV